jgi:hypothetical protein
MTIPHDKDALLALIDSSFEKLAAELTAVPEHLAHERSLEGHAKGTQMSACDLVAYLVGWNELVLKWLERDAAGLPIDFPETDFKWNELGKLAQKFYRDHEDVALPQLLERLDAAKGAIVAAIASRDNAILYERPWYGTWTMGRMIQFNTASPYANARSRLRSWLKAKNLPIRG